MLPISFKHQTRVLKKPPSWDEKEQGPCVDLPVFITQRGTVWSCWKGSWRDRLKFLIYGRVWLHVCQGDNSQPAVALIVEKEILKEV